MIAHETQSMLVLSVEHISPTTAGLLELGSDTVPVTYVKGIYGFFVVVPETALDTPRDCPDDLRGLLALCRLTRCAWLMLDVDGPVQLDLPRFGWQ